MPRPKKRPRPSRSLPLNPATTVFLDQDEYAFQRVSQEAYNSEPGIAVCSLYGNRGEKQHGVDLIGTCHHGPGLEVVQCRRYAMFTAAQVETATADFLKEWKHWKKLKVRRFVLVTSADISAKGVQDAILTQHAIFRKKRIKYTAWGCHELCTKLNPHRSAVQQLYGSDGADRICGPVADTPPLRALQSIMSNHLGNVLVELEKDRGDQLENLREASREGRHGEALAAVMAMKAAASWAALNASLRARCLKFEASLRLNVGEPAAVAAGLVEDAKRLDPQGDYQVIDAYVAYRKSNAHGGLALLEKPGSIDAWNTRWAMLFEAGRHGEIAAEYRAQEARLVANAETRRLLALTALLARDLPTAQAEIARAASLQPKHRSIRLAGAIIDYRSCIVTIADAGPNLTWPAPVSWSFVRRDPDSLIRLRRAADQFRELRQLPHEPEVERRLLETWELACLACDPTRALEAEACAQARLGENLAHYRVVAWAVERDYAFDHATVTLALAARLQQKPAADPDAHLALCAVLLADGKLKAAEKALDAAEADFKDSGNHDVWKVQKVQFLARRRARTTQLVASIDDPKLREHARRAALHPGKGRLSDFRRLAQELAKEYERTGSASVLFQCCDTFYRAKDFAFIGDKAVELVEKVGTDSALRLALHGSFYAGKYGQCLDLLRKHRGLLQGGQLSPELRRLQAACQEKLGQWQEAIREAEALYRERAEVRSFDEFFRILVQTGDTRRAAILARDLPGLRGVTVPALLRGAHVARLHDVELAQELWRKAAKMPLGNLSSLSAVVGMAFELGVEQEAVALQQRMFARARRNRGPIQMKTMAETLEFFRHRRSEHERLAGAYNRSEAPIHLIAPQLGVPLVYLYHQQLEDNRGTKNLTAVPALLARYGGRALPESCPPEMLYADLTGLLLAADLGVLDLIEQNLGPIYIAPEATLSLVEQVGRSRPHQPSQHVWRTELARMVAAEEIRLVDPPAEELVPAEHPLQALGPQWHATWRTAREEKSLLVAEWPLLAEGDDRQVVAMPDEFADGIVNLRELIHAAAFAGGLPAAEFAAQVGPMGVFRLYPERAEAALKWPVGRTVLLTDITLQILAGQGLLKPVGSVFKLAVLRKDFDRIAAEEKGHARQMALAEWTQGVLEQIQRGIAQDRYRVLPQTIVDKKADQLGMDAQGLGNLLRAVAANNKAALWADDRMVNRHPLSGSRPIVGLLEVLRMLQGKGVLTEKEWAEHLTHLRRSNVRYIPTTAAEIQHHVALAQVAGGELVETPALSALRRYYGACVLDRGRLLGPGQQGPGQDLKEWNFVLELRHAVDEAFRETWAQKGVALEVREARANWLWRALYVDVVGVRHTLVNEFRAGEERELTAFLVGSLFSLGIAIPFRPGQKGEKTAREAYFEWLDRRLLQPLEHSNPGFTDLVAGVVAKDLQRTCREAMKLTAEKVRKAQIYLSAHLMMSLPEPLMQKVALPADVLAAMGVKVHGPSVGVEGRTYDLAALNRAQVDALNGRPADVKERDGPQTLYLERDAAATGLVLKLRTERTGQAKTWRDPMFGVLLDDPAARIDHLEKLGFWFDCELADRRQAIQEICALERPTERVTRLQTWINESPEVAYRELDRELRGQEGVGFDQLELANWRRLLRHLRLAEKPARTPAEEFAAAAAVLREEEGLLVALRRCMALPRRLPEDLEQALRGLAPAEAAELWEKLPRFPRSVLGDLHLIRLVHLRDDLDRAVVENLLAELFDPTKSVVLFESFHAVLNWVNREMSRWPERHQVPAWLRLAMVWYHAARLHSLFRANAVELPKLAEWFKSNSSSWHHGVMDYEPAYAEDVSHPNLAGTGSILINGLGHLLEGIPVEAVAALGVAEKWKALEAKETEYAAGMKLDLCRRKECATDALGSFLPACSAEMRDQLLGAGWDKDIKLASSEADFGALIEQAAKAPTAVESWSPLLASLRELPAPTAVRPAMHALVMGMDFETFVAKESGWGLAVLIFATAQTRSGADAVLRDRLEEQVLKIAAGPWRAKLPDEEARRCDLSLLQALLALAIVPGDEVATASNYFEKIGRLMRAQPAAAQMMSGPIRHWLVALPFEQQRGLRVLWYTIRSLQ